MSTLDKAEACQEGECQTAPAHRAGFSPVGSVLEARAVNAVAARLSVGIASSQPGSLAHNALCFPPGYPTFTFSWHISTPSSSTGGLRGPQSMASPGARHPRSRPRTPGASSGWGSGTEPVLVTPPRWQAPVPARDGSCRTGHRAPGPPHGGRSTETCEAGCLVRVGCLAQQQSRGSVPGRQPRIPPQPTGATGRGELSEPESWQPSTQLITLQGGEKRSPHLAY